MFEREDVYLSIDFENKIWKLHNLHRFDNKGDIILEDGKYGTCGELAAHTYKKIERLLGKDYDIKFVETAQSGFFLSPKASHIVLYITEKSGLWRGRDKKIYILDASFHKYGPIGDFEDYLFLEFMSTLPFVERKETDIAMPLSKSIPLLI